MSTATAAPRQSVADRLRGQAASPSSAPAQVPAHGPPPYIEMGGFWINKTRESTLQFISGNLGAMGRLSIFPNKIDPTKPPPAPNAPTLYSLLSRQTTKEQRERKEFGPDITFVSFWENVTPDGKDYLNSTLKRATERSYGMLLQLWPNTRKRKADDPDYLARIVFTPPIQPNDSPATGDAAQADTELPHETAANGGEEIPF